MISSSHIMVICKKKIDRKAAEFGLTKGYTRVAKDCSYNPGDTEDEDADADGDAADGDAADTDWEGFLDSVDT